MLRGKVKRKNGEDTKKKGNLVPFVDNNNEDDNNTIEDNKIARTRIGTNTMRVVSYHDNSILRDVCYHM